MSIMCQPQLNKGARVDKNEFSLRNLGKVGRGERETHVNKLQLNTTYFNKSMCTVS